MMRPSEVGTATESFEVETATGAAAEACTSEARTSPPGPVPRSAEMSTPSSLARRRALGEILAEATVDDATAPLRVEDAGSALGCDVARAAGAGAPLSAGGF